MCRVHASFETTKRRVAKLRRDVYRSYKVPFNPSLRKDSFLRNLRRILKDEKCGANLHALANTSSRDTRPSVSSQRSSSRREMRTSRNVALLYKHCLATFEGANAERAKGTTVACAQFKPSNIQPLGRFINELTLKDLNVEAQSSISKVVSEGATLGHMNVFEVADCSVSVFILPPGTCIPLHDHKDMCVITKILHGSARMVAYDLASEEESVRAKTQMEEQFPLIDRDTLQLVTPVTDKVIGTGTSRALFPTFGGNIHLIQADPITGCIMIDIQAPPYTEDSEGACTYFAAISGAMDFEGIKGRKAVLQRCSAPPSLSVLQIPYKGQKYWD